ncbi:hypothetical protein MHYP_G00366450 [Metynnis hypsauchen]
MKYTHHVLELKESYPRQLCQCCPPQTFFLEGLERRDEGTMLSLPYGHLWQCCDTREVPPGRLGDVERKDCLAVDVLPVVPNFAIGHVEGLWLV